MIPSLRVNWLSLTGENKQTVKNGFPSRGKNQKSAKNLTFPDFTIHLFVTLTESIDTLFQVY